MMVLDLITVLCQEKGRGMTIIPLSQHAGIVLVSSWINPGLRLTVECTGAGMQAWAPFPVTTGQHCCRAARAEHLCQQHRQLWFPLAACFHTCLCVVATVDVDTASVDAASHTFSVNSRTRIYDPKIRA